MDANLYTQALAVIEDKIAKIDFFRGVMRTEPAGEHEALWRLRFTVMEWHKPEVRYVNPEYSGSFSTEDGALDDWDPDIDGIEGKPELTTFIVCAACGALTSVVSIPPTRGARPSATVSRTATW